MAVRIVIDSSADYEKQEMIDKNLICVPLSGTFGEKSYQDCFELTKDEFYQKLLERKDYPKTSQPSPEAFLKEFLAEKESGDSVVAILLASDLSGTCQSANLAKNMAEYDDIHIIDSTTAISAMRFLIEKAIAMRDAGNTAEEIVAVIEELKTRVGIRVVIDTLEYLYKGGRLTKAQAGVGEIARLKPMIMLNKEGKIEVCQKCLGMKKAMLELKKILETTDFDPEYGWKFVYAHERENCEKFCRFLEDKGVEIWDKTKSMYNIGPTIGAHTGNGVFGFVYVEKKK